MIVECRLLTQSLFLFHMTINQTTFQRRDSSRSPMSNRRRHVGDREEPDPSKCIGVFGLSLYTTERQLDKEFGRSAYKFASYMYLMTEGETLQLKRQ